MKRARKSAEKTVTLAQIRAAKARDRQRDWRRLARGEVTPQQLQDENAVVKDAHLCRIVNLKAVTRQYRTLNRRKAVR